jgi:hypothetical protein
MKRLASPASTDRHAAHHWTGAFSAPRMRTPLGPSRTSWSLHRIPSISDALVVTCRHARVGLRNRPMRWPSHPRLREAVPDVYLQAEGPWNTLPVRVRCTAARKRLPSY